MKIDMDKVAMLYEIRGVYDGWSAALMKDGTVLNRWDEDDDRYLPTEDFIDGLMIDRAATAEWEAGLHGCLRCDWPTHLEHDRCVPCQIDWESERS